MASAGHPSQYFYDSHVVKELDYTGPLMGFNQNVNYTLREISFNKQSSNNSALKGLKPDLLIFSSLNIFNRLIIFLIFYKNVIIEVFLNK
jgi:hypothetical protein